MAKFKQLRMKAMLTKKELSNFICLRRDGGSEEKQEGKMVNMKGMSVSTMAREVGFGDSGNGLK